MAGIVTQFVSLTDYRKGGVGIINDVPRNYVFSNVFEVAANSAAYERVAVGKNFEYVIEAARAEGVSPWFTCAHDEFVLCMDGDVEVHLVKLADLSVIDLSVKGAQRVQGAPDRAGAPWIISTATACGEFARPSDVAASRRLPGNGTAC